MIVPSPHEALEVIRSETEIRRGERSRHDRLGVTSGHFELQVHHSFQALAQLKHACDTADIETLNAQVEVGVALERQTSSGPEAHAANPRADHTQVPDGQSGRIPRDGGRPPQVPALVGKAQDQFVEMQGPYGIFPFQRQRRLIALLLRPHNQQVHAAPGLLVLQADRDRVEDPAEDADVVPVNLCLDVPLRREEAEGGELNGSLSHTVASVETVFQASPSRDIELFQGSSNGQLSVHTPRNEDLLQRGQRVGIDVLQGEDAELQGRESIPGDDVAPEKQGP